MCTSLSTFLHSMPLANAVCWFSVKMLVTQTNLFTMNILFSCELWQFTICYMSRFPNSCRQVSMCKDKVSILIVHIFTFLSLCVSESDFFVSIFIQRDVFWWNSSLNLWLVLCRQAYETIKTFYLPASSRWSCWQFQDHHQKQQLRSELLQPWRQFYHLKPVLINLTIFCALFYRSVSKKKEAICLFLTHFWPLLEQVFFFRQLRL